MRAFSPGRLAWGVCQRCGLRDYRNNLVYDERIKGLIVHPECKDPFQIQERPIDVSDPIAIRNPSPEVSIEPGHGIPAPDMDVIYSMQFATAQAVPTTITMSPSIATITTGHTAQLIATVYDQYGRVMPVTPTWSSDAPSVATVDGTGMVSGITAGTANISATYVVVGAATVTVASATDSVGTGVDLHPRYGISTYNPGSIISIIPGLTAFGTSGVKGGSFTVITTNNTDFVWMAIPESVAGGAGGTVTFTDVGNGGINADTGWYGATTAGGFVGGANNDYTGTTPQGGVAFFTTAADGNGTIWHVYRMNYHNACPSPGSTFSIS